MYYYYGKYLRRAANKTWMEDGSVQKAHGFGAFESNVRQRAVCQKKIEKDLRGVYTAGDGQCS